MSDNLPSELQKISLYPLASREQQNNLFTTSVPTLLSISHGLENAVIRNRLQGVFYAGFQRTSAFLPQVNRFSQLASICGKVLVFAHADAPVPEIPGVEFVLLDAEAPLTQEWFIIFSHPDFTAALLTRQISEEHGQQSDLEFGRGRAYQGVVTFQPALVQSAQHELDSVLQRTQSGTATAGLTAPAPAYQTFMQVFTTDLELRNQQLNSLYKNLVTRNVELERLHKTVQTMVSQAAWDDVTRTDYEAERVVLKKEKLSVLMADIEGFTSLSETVPPEILIADLNQFMDLLATSIYQGRGDIDKFLGDGVLAFFTDGREALHTAIRIQQRVKAFNVQQLAKRHTVFKTRVGLTTGMCLIARVGSRDRQDVTLIGDTVNRASRLQALSESGWVLIDEETFTACGNPPTTPMVVQIKGKREMQNVHQVLPEQFAKVEMYLQTR